jgi:dipeptidyl aminopeptidase/acylaminoacyl peptidase
MKKLFFFAVSALILVSCGEKSGSDASSGQPSVTKSDSLASQPITETRVTPELLWKFGRVGETVLSPDGKTIAITITRYSISENKGYTDIYTIPSDGGEMKRITGFAGPEFNIQWSVDGTLIYFLATESGSSQLWQMNANGSGQRQISSVEGDISSFKISPDSKKILYCKDVKLDKSPADIHTDLPKTNVYIAEDLMYRHWNSWTDYHYSHVFVSDMGAEVKEGKDIMENEKFDSPLSPYFDAEEITWSPDGNIIAYTCKKQSGKDYAVSTNSDIYLYTVSDGTTKNVTEGMMGYDKYPVFSPDGKYIAWQSMETPGYESDKERLFVMDLATGTKTYLNENFDQNAAHYFWTEDAKEIFFISGYHATHQVYKINVETKEVKQITSGKHDYTAIQQAGGVFIGNKMSMQMATEIFKIDIATGQETQISFVNKNIYDKVQMGTSVERWVKTTDGKQMLVWVILPPGFDSTKTYPAFLYCQGGPQSAVSQFWSYRWNFQIMAANDYVVIAPNRRGLPSFGQEWNRQISGDYGGQNMKDYLSATDAIAKEPWVDANRLGAVGASYGGFSVYWLAGNHNKRFKAFISHCGMFNLESQYAETEEVFFTEFDLGGPYWDKNNTVAQRSYANSPHRFVKNWDTPILIISGGYDFRIPYTESLQAFNTAQLLGIPSKLLIFPEETHFVLKPQNSILWQREFFGWLDKWLK